MSPGRRSPLLPVLLFALTCAGLTYGTLHLLGHPLHWAYAAVIGYLGLTTWLLHHWQEEAMHTDPKGFVRRFMTGLVVKMLVSLFLLLAIVFLVPGDLALPLALMFALLYLAFLGFSTARLVNLSRTMPKA